jgi:hypothetical protein
MIDRRHAWPRVHTGVYMYVRTDVCAVASYMHMYVRTVRVTHEPGIYN